MRLLQARGCVIAYRELPARSNHPLIADPSCSSMFDRHPDGHGIVDGFMEMRRSSSASEKLAPVVRVLYGACPEKYDSVRS